MIKRLFRSRTHRCRRGLNIHVSTDSGSSVWIFTGSARMSSVGSMDWFLGRQAAWNWTAYGFTPSPYWNPGVYVAVFVESQDPRYDIDPLEGFGYGVFCPVPPVLGRAAIP
jgi:hypothetical protein